MNPLLIPRPSDQACTICLAPLYRPADQVLFPCNHAHCLACLRRNFNLAIGLPNPHAPPLSPADPPPGPFRPVQCCPHARLPLPHLRRALRLTSAEAAAYRARLTEHDAPPAARLYCFDAARCGRFIPPALRDGRVGRCRACWGRTCVRCGGRAHARAGECKGGGGGPGWGRKATAVAVVDEEGFRRVVKEMGWKQCPDCNRWVEKTEGCNHILCLCGCHFCYRCGRAPYGNHGECAM